MHTTNSSSVWTTESSQGKQAWYGIVGVVLGGALVYGSRSQGLEQLTGTAALILGLLILGVSLATLVIGGKQVISVDPRRGLVRIETLSRFGNTSRVIPLSQVKDVSIGELGDKEGGSISYHVALHLQNGKEVALFVGAFEGVYDRKVMEARRQRLDQYLKARSGHG